MIKIEKLLRKTQEQLFEFLSEKYKEIAVVKKKEFIYVPGEAPVLLVAHLDTVHREKVKVICYSRSGNILMSPQGIGGDDRCGVYALMKLYETATVKPHMVFTCDEETGGYGAESFALYMGEEIEKTNINPFKLIVEIDRKGNKDAVYYDCDNKEFETYINSKGFITDFGTFTDISLIAPVVGIAGVNLSSGYYNAHTQYEYIDRKDLYSTIHKVESIIKDSIKKDFPVYKYIKAKNSFFGGYGYSTALELDNDWKEDLSETVPLYLQEQYDYLSSIYGQKEIDEYRKLYGNSVLHELYEQEIEYENENTQAHQGY